ncbi:MAG: glycosyltransferase family 2 protein [Flavobacteriales bacterium]|nr:glycosyltransferase family 2 protein [Flavobacteriales bacterium]
MRSDMFLSIIIPVYNEEALVPEVVKLVASTNFPSTVTYWEIVIVDDCSTDATYSVVEKLIQEIPQVRLIRHNKNMGKGAAVRTGISNAHGNVFLIQDADLELRPQDIPRMVECMEELGVEFVNGSRYMEGVYRPLSSYKRYLANKLFTLLTSILINVKITDMACGYKLFHKNLYEKITLRENRFGFEAELIIKALRVKRNNIAEVPVRYFPRNEGEGKKLRNMDAFKILWTIIKYGLLRMK